MTLNTYFNARFCTMLAGLEFFAEVQCENIQALAERCRANALRMTSPDQPDIDLVAAEICFELAREDGKGCRTLDEESEALLVTVLKSLRVGAQRFYNERLGSYDKFNNRITPADLGIVFPDGTLRVVWDLKESAFDFDTTLEVLSGALGMLLELQEVPYGSQSDDELEDDDFESLKTRRIEVLFEAGLWPASDDTFEPLATAAIAQVMDTYRSKAVPTPATA